MPFISRPAKSAAIDRSAFIHPCVNARSASLTDRLEFPDIAPAMRAEIGAFMNICKTIGAISANDQILFKQMSHNSIHLLSISPLLRGDLRGVLSPGIPLLEWVRGGLLNPIIRPDNLPCFTTRAQNKSSRIRYYLFFTVQEITQEITSVAIIFNYRIIFNTIVAIINVWHLPFQFSGANSAYNTHLYRSILRFFHSVYLCLLPFFGHKLSYFSPRATAIASCMRLDLPLPVITIDTVTLLTLFAGRYPPS